MFTMRPHRARIIPGSTCCVHRKVPARFTSMTASQSAAFMRIARPSRVMPALLTSTSTRVFSLSTRAKASFTDSGELTSRLTRIDWPPQPGHAPISAASCSSCSMPRAANTTSNPARHKENAMARPIPRLAPVTTATRLLILAPYAVLVSDTHLNMAYQDLREFIRVLEKNHELTRIPFEVDPNLE